MKHVPKYVLKLLERRRRLSNKLMDVNAQIDEYCSKIGVDMTDENACVGSDIKIYCETDAGCGMTLEAIKKALERQSKMG